MERLLHRWMWLLDGAVIAIAAIFAAHATARWFSRIEIHGLPGQIIEEYVASNKEPPAKKIEAILRRHIFCHACEAFRPGPSSDVEQSAPRPTSLPLRLVAVMYAPRPVDRRWSVAIVRDEVVKATQPFIVGSPLRDATIDAIEATRVYLQRRDGRREVLELLEPAPSLTAGAQAAPVTGPVAAAPSFRDGIRQLGDRRYEIQRRTDGIRPGGPLAAIGLRNGDAIRAINGLDLDSPERAIDAYLKLRAASHISIAADRAGRRIELDYDVR